MPHSSPLSTTSTVSPLSSNHQHHHHNHHHRRSSSSNLKSNLFSSPSATSAAAVKPQRPVYRRNYSGSVFPLSISKLGSGTRIVSKKTTSKKEEPSDDSGMATSFLQYWYVPFFFFSLVFLRERYIYIYHPSNWNRTDDDLVPLVKNK